MAKTIKEIADELGVEKQKVYRFIKQNCISEVHHEALQRNGVKYYDEAAEMMIKQGLSTSGVSDEAHQNHINEAAFDAVIDMLKKELDLKNEQIRELNARLSECSAALIAAQKTAQAAQALHAGAIQQQLVESVVDSASEKPQGAAGTTVERKGWLSRLFRK